MFLEVYYKKLGYIILGYRENNGHYSHYSHYSTTTGLDIVKKGTKRTSPKYGQIPRRSLLFITGLIASKAARHIEGAITHQLSASARHAAKQGGAQKMIIPVFRVKIPALNNMIPQPHGKPYAGKDPRDFCIASGFYKTIVSKIVHFSNHKELLCPLFTTVDLL